MEIWSDMMNDSVCWVMDSSAAALTAGRAFVARFVLPIVDTPTPLSLASWTVVLRVASPQLPFVHAQNATKGISCAFRPIYGL
jgi:hypothetical protein